MNFEAVSLNSRQMVRRCLVLWWKDLNPELLHQTITNNLGAVLIVLPESLNNLDDADKQVHNSINFLRDVMIKLLLFRR